MARVVWLKSGDGLVFSSTTRIGATSNQLWYVSYPAGEVSRITNDLNSYGQFSLGVTADGSTLVTVLSVPHTNLWVATGNYKDAKEVTQSEEDGTEGVDAAAGKIAYTSFSPGISTISTANIDGSGSVQVSPADEFCGSPTISRDGRYVGFTCLKAGNPNIWIANADGSDLRQLTFGNADLQPAFSPTAHSFTFSTGPKARFTSSRYRSPAGSRSRSRTCRSRINPSPHRGDRIVVKYFDDKASQWKVGILSAADGKFLATG